MTPKQKANEKESIEKFTTGMVRRVRTKGTNAAVTRVLLAAAEAAADSAVRHADGSINTDEAENAFYEAALLMTKFRSNRSR